MALAAALFLAVFGLLPIANWIPGGHEAPWYGSRMLEWSEDTAILLAIAIVAAIMLQRRPDWWRTGAWSRVAARWRASRRADLLIAALSFLTCAWLSQFVLSAKPLLIDEVISLFQARIFATGHLWLPAPPWPEFTSAMHLLDWNGKVYGQFPAGGPAMLMVGVLLHVPWLVGPAATGVAVFCFARLLRRLDVRDGTALAALLLFAFAPFTLFLGASMMNHVTAMMWIIVAALALSHATGDDAAHPRAALAMGLALGIAASIRPTDAAAFALPSAAWLLWRARGGARHFGALVASGIGVAIPLALVFFVNWQQNGHPFRFGYIEMWGTSHELGFHAAPWGPPHTPARGIELINLYMLRLQDYFLETAGPSLLFATLALGLTRSLRAFDRWILAGCGLLLLGYFAYWHDGFYLGPRFVLPLAPWLALWTARLPAELEARRFKPVLVQATVVAGVGALLGAIVVGVPIRAVQYRSGMLSMRIDVDSAAAASGVHDAVVLVRESWGAQLLARMWGLGVTRPDAEHIYRTTDACRMSDAIAATEADHSGATGLERRIAALHVDSARLVRHPSLPDTTARFLPGQPLTPECIRRMIEDQAGFALMPAFLLARGGNNIYVRDLHAADSLVIAQHPGAPVWLVTKSPRVGSAYRFERVLLDSARADWQRE